MTVVVGGQLGSKVLLVGRVHAGVPSVVGLLLSVLGSVLLVDRLLSVLLNVLLNVLLLIVHVKGRRLLVRSHLLRGHVLRAHGLRRMGLLRNLLLRHLVVNDLLVATKVGRLMSLLGKIGDGVKVGAEGGRLRRLAMLTVVDLWLPRSVDGRVGKRSVGLLATFAADKPDDGTQKEDECEDGNSNTDADDGGLGQVGTATGDSRLGGAGSGGGLSGGDGIGRGGVVGDRIRQGGSNGSCGGLGGVRLVGALLVSVGDGDGGVWRRKRWLARRFVDGQKRHVRRV